MGIAQYNKKGMYNGYDKNNKEREALDYYSTPTEEVENILSIIKCIFTALKSMHTFLSPVFSVCFIIYISKFIIKRITNIRFIYSILMRS